MVYRLYRANRFLMSRIFVVLIIYSLIIGTIGFVLLGVVINFDGQSFNPQLYDVNVQNPGSNSKEGLLCASYKTEQCNWYFANDLPTARFDRNISEFRYRIDNQNLLVLQYQNSNNTILGEAQAELFNQPIGLSSNINPNIVNASNALPDMCILLANGTNCIGTNIKFQLIPNLNIYSGSNLGYFLGSRVLLEGKPSSANPTGSISNVLCESYPANCQFQQLGPFNYSYFGPTITKGSKTITQDTSITAYQAIIKPSSSITEVGNLQDASRTGQISTICVDEGLNTTDSCSGTAFNVQETPADTGIFTFVDGQNNILVGTLSLNVLFPSQNDILNYNVNNKNLGCFKTTQNPIFDINGSEPFSCSNVALSDSSATTTQTTGYLKYIEFPLDGSINTNAPKVVFSLGSDSIHVMLVIQQFSTQGKSTPGILFNIITKPSVLLRSILNIDFSQKLLVITLIFFVVNLLLSFLMILFRFWKRIGGFLGPRATFFQTSRIGRLLEMTQFFQFGGSWYLEAQSVNDYNFKTTMGVVHELLRERWRDTIFFPTSLAASISIVIFSFYANADSLFSLVIIGGILPLLLAFWIPGLWTIEDSGLKRADWSGNGELLTIQKISDILRDGFNKLVGFGAIFGIGTAGASAARAKITGSSVSSSTAITGGFDNLINLNFNFLVSAILWTTALLFIVTAVSMTGNVITSLSYLNSDHLANVKKMRTRLQQKEVFLGTTQPALDHANTDTSIYFDSKQGIDSAMAKQISTGKTQSMPSNQVITGLSFSSEDDLTKIIITNPKDSDVGVKPISDADYKPDGEGSSLTASDDSVQDEPSTEENKDSSTEDTSDTSSESKDESTDENMNEQKDGSENKESSEESSESSESKVTSKNSDEEKF